jgi:glutathione S-transferase
MAATIELFSFEGCPFAQRVRLALIEKEIDFDLIEIDLHNRPAWFAEISPYGKVPVIRHQGRIVYESGIINQYLDEAFPARPLMPTDAFGRAQARIWMDYCDNRYLPATHRLMAERGDPARLEAHRKALDQVLSFIEHEALRRLGPGPFWMGPQPTLVDCHFLPFFERFSVLEELAGARWPEECTRLQQWYAAASGRPAFLATRHTADFHIDQQLRLEARRRGPPA